MLRSLGFKMATALHKVPVHQHVPALAATSQKLRLPSALSLASSSSSASPLTQPWWRQLSLSLPQTCASPMQRAAQWPAPLRHVSVRAAEGEAAAEVAEAAPEVAEGAAEEAAPVKTKALTKQVKHIMNILNAEAAQSLKSERNIPDFWPGDVLAMKVEVPENKRRVSLVRGIVIARRNAGINSTFRIRRMMAGVGVEMVFPLFSPNIKEIKVVDRRRARRAKLYYLRDKIARLSTVN